MKKSTLKRNTPLKALKGLRYRSEKAKANEALWQLIKISRAVFLHEKYDVVICEYCGRPAWGNELGTIDAHHIDGNHKHSTEDNCYLVHRICHDEIKRRHLKVKQLGFEGIKNVDI